MTRKAIMCTLAEAQILKMCAPLPAQCANISLHASGADLLLSMLQGLSNICWAHAKLGAEVTEEVARLLEALAVEAVSQLMDIRSRQKFIPQVCVCSLSFQILSLARSSMCCLHQAVERLLVWLM